MPIPLGVLAVAGAGGGAAGSSFDLLETTILGTNTASVTFSSLDSYSGYKHLQLRMTGRSANAATGAEDYRIRLNGDTGSNYASHNLAGSGSTVFSTANTSIIVGVGLFPGNNETAGIFGAGVFDILDFSSADKYTTIRGLYGQNNAGSPRIALGSGLWKNTNAVTSITFFADSGNMLTGSRFSLYGIK